MNEQLLAMLGSEFDQMRCRHGFCNGLLFCCSSLLVLVTAEIKKREGLKEYYPGLVHNTA